MNRINKVSRVTRIFLLFLFYTAPVALTVSWLTKASSLWIFDLRLFPGVIGHVDQLPKLFKIYGFLMSLIPTLCAMVILFHLAKLFSFYEKNEFFEIQNARCLKISGLTILIWELIHPLYDVLMSYVLTSAQGHAVIQFQFDVSNLRGIIIGVVLYVIAWIMQEANRLKEEQDYTI